MKRDDIIRMAREAGFNTDHDLICIEGWEISPYMQRFAALVAAEKDREIAELLKALEGMLDIVTDSIGVAGYHLNGETADWREFPEINSAYAAIAKARGQNE